MNVLPDDDSKESKQKMRTFKTKYPSMKTLVCFEPHFLGFSNARSLFEKLPKGRRVATEQEAHIMLYDDVRQAVQEFERGDRSILRVVVQCTGLSPKLPKGMFWIEDDIVQLLSLIRTLHPGEVQV